MEDIQRIISCANDAIEKVVNLENENDALRARLARLESESNASAHTYAFSKQENDRLHAKVSVLEEKKGLGFSPQRYSEIKFVEAIEDDINELRHILESQRKRALAEVSRHGTFGMKYECLQRSLILNPIVAFEEWDDSRQKHYISGEIENPRIGSNAATIDCQQEYDTACHNADGTYSTRTVDESSVDENEMDSHDDEIKMEGGASKIRSDIETNRKSAANTRKEWGAVQGPESFASAGPADFSYRSRYDAPNIYTRIDSGDIEISEVHAFCTENRTHEWNRTVGTTNPKDLSGRGLREGGSSTNAISYYSRKVSATRNQFGSEEEDNDKTRGHDSGDEMKGVQLCAGQILANCFQKNKKPQSNKRRRDKASKGTENTDLDSCFSGLTGKLSFDDDLESINESTTAVHWQGV